MALLQLKLNLATFKIMKHTVVDLSFDFKKVHVVKKIKKIR